MNVANFGPIAEGAPVYGACRPGHLGADVPEWATILEDAGVGTVVCLLSEQEAARWRLPAAYEGTFDAHHVPIRDRYLPDVDRLRRAVDLLERATVRGEGAAVHCNAGLGRTGVVGAAWLVHADGLDPATAVEVVESGPARRSPREAVRDDNATEAELYDLLATL